jgi:hypothetical protein
MRCRSPGSPWTTQRIALTLLVLLSLAAVLAIIHSCARAGASALR